MIEVDPEAALELLDARDYYEGARPGLGAIFELVAQRTLDAIESAQERFPAHPFATTPDVHRALFLRPPRFPTRSRTSYELSEVRTSSRPNIFSGASNLGQAVGGPGQRRRRREPAGSNM